MANAELAINIKANNQSKAAFAAVKRDIGGIKSALGDVAKFAGGQMLASGLQAGARAMVGAVKGMIGTFAAMSREAADFNAQISTIGSVMGATAAEMAALKKEASNLGIDPNLKVSATEAAQAIEMLGRNGIKTQEILDGAAKATVLLSNATGAEFATSANIGASAMSVFKISAKDMVDAVDGIVSVTTNSKLDLHDYELAIAQAGGVARTSGVSFADFNTYLAGTASIFKGGSDSGTAFKMFLQNLTPQTKPAIETMRELGLLTADGSNAFYDSTGNLKGMNEIAGILNKTLANMTELQRSNTLETLFGTDSSRVAIGLMELGKEGFEELQATMAKTDATKAASVRMDNLAGDMEIFQGVVDSLRIQIGDEFDPALRQMFQAATSTLSGLQPVIVGFAHNIGQGMAGGIQSVRDYKAEFDKLFNFFGEDRVSSMLSAIGNLTGGTVSAPIGKTTVEVDWGGLKASFDRATEDLSLSIGDIVTGTFNLKDYTTTLSIGDFFTGTLNLKDKITSISLGDFFAGAQIGTGGKITLTFNDTQFDFDLGAIKERMIAQFNLLKTGIILAVTMLNFNTVRDMVSGAIKSLPGLVVEKVGGATAFNFSSVATSIANRIKALPAAITAKVGELAGITSIATSLQTGVDALIGPNGAIRKGINFALGIVAEFSAALGGADLTTVGEKVSVVTEDITAFLKTFNDFQTDIISTAGETLSEFVVAVTDFATQVATMLDPEVLSAAISIFATGMIDKITVALSSIDLASITGALAGLIGSLGQLLRDVIEGGLFRDIGASIGELVKGAIKQVSDILANPEFGQGLGEGLANGVIAIIRGSFDSIAGLTEGLEGVSGFDLFASLGKFVINFFQGIIAALRDVDWASLGQSILDALVGGLKTSIAAIPIFDLIFNKGGVGDLLTGVITPLDWTKFITVKLSDWSTYVGSLEWVQFVTSKLSDWSTFVTQLSWATFMTMFPGWSMFITGINIADMIPAFPGWDYFFGGNDNFTQAAQSYGSGGGSGGFGGSSGPTPNPSGGGGRRGFVPVTENAQGTNFFEGGWTWVGEEGPELLNLPRGSKIMSNPDSKKMIGQMADGNTTAPTGAFGGLTKILGFAASVIDQSVKGWTTEAEKNNASTEQNTTAVDANSAAAAAAANASTTASAQTAKTLGTVGELIRVSAEEYAKAAGGGNYIIDGVAHFSDEMTKLMESFGDGLEGALQSVPGLFGTSEVTAEQMKLGEMGIPQNFADDYVRRLTDEVLNGVDWADVDIADAALRAGIDPGLPAKTILEMFKQKWNDKSLFADPANLDLINLDAVQAELQRQAAMKAGAQNLLSMFGITPESAEADGQATGQKVGTGVLTGMKSTLAGGDAGEGLTAALSGSVTEESMADASAAVVGGLTTEMGKAEYGEQMATAIGSLFSSFLENTEALAGIAQGIMEAVAKAFTTVTNVDMVSNFASSFSTQLNSKEAGDALSKVGEKILELVYKGYLGAAEERNWAEGVNARGDEAGTTTAAHNATGTRNWRGGWTWVGDGGGPELVNLPAHSRIFSNSDSMAMAGAGAVNIEINATVSNDLDIERLAYRVADVIRGRRR